MESRDRQLLPSGIEPVDKLLGGLEINHLYLVHGEAAGKSLFGIKFLIEGLKRGENTALVIRYSPEDAVRRFARLGYDCLDDVYSGRLVILEYSDDIIQRIARLPSLMPVLRELEWLLGEARPRRLVLDPVTSLVVSDVSDLEPRVGEFVGWARQFGATVVLVANGDNQEVIRSLKPLVEESFRFEVIETPERATRLMAFEKSDLIKPQVIEVDPSRGVFLLGRSQKNEPDPEPPVTTQGMELLNEAEMLDPLAIPARPAEGRQEDMDSAKVAVAEQHKTDREDLLSVFLEDLASASFPLDVNINEPETARVPADESFGRASTLRAADTDPSDDKALDAVESGEPGTPPPHAPTPVEAGARPLERRGASRGAIDRAVASRAVEMLLRPPDFKDDSPTLAETADIKPPPRAASQESVIAPASLNPKDFNVLVIDDDQTECDFITEALSEYNVETVHDGVAGLAKLISFKPDLVVLDVDLPIIDGFKVLAHIRSSLNMPIIIVSGSRVRASDRMLSAELGADYYLTKPYSAKELRHKARQLIARYRGISSWIVTAPRESPAGRDRPVQGAATSPTPRAPETDAHGFVSYSEFASQVEKRIHIAIDKGPAFSVVGCRLSEMTANAGRTAFRLYEMIRALVRETDVVSTNPRNDMLILLVDADTAGARAFVTRLRARVMEDMSHNLLVWVRSFPDLQEVSDTPKTEKSPADRGQFNRRASDRRNQGDDISPGIFGARKAAATGARAEYLRKEESNSEP